MEKVIYTSKDRIPTTASDVGNGILSITAVSHDPKMVNSILVWKNDIDAIHAAIHEGDEPEIVFRASTVGQSAEWEVQNSEGKVLASSDIPFGEPEPVADCCWNCTLFTPGEDKDTVVCNRYPLERYFYDVNPRKKYCGEHRRKDA